MPKVKMTEDLDKNNKPLSEGQNQNKTPEIQKKPGFKKYNSPVFVNHRIGGSIQFENGFYQAKSTKEENDIESDPFFNQKIFISEVNTDE